MGKSENVEMTGCEAAGPLRPAVPSFWYYALAVLVILFFVFIRIRMLDMPLERDEGEYAYAGQLILQGIPPYDLAYNMKLPGTYAAYSLILGIFGQTPRAVHIGLLLINTATVILMYFLGARLFGRLAGVISSAVYSLLSAGVLVLGFAGHATHFVVLPAIGGILLLLKGLESERPLPYFWSGLLLGVAFIMKQPGIFFVIFSGLYLLRSEWQRPAERRGKALRCGVFFLGAILPFTLTCLILLRAGVFHKFWFWTFSYAREYATAVGISDGIQLLWYTTARIIGPAVWIWCIAAAGLAALLWNREARTRAVFTSGFLFFSFAAVCPGLYFRSHYFILLLPAISLLAGIAVSTSARGIFDLSRSLRLAAIPVIVFFAAFAAAVFHQRELYFEKDPIAACRSVYGENPFPEAVTIADYIRASTPKSARIAILGSEPEIYFYSGRRSATGYIYMYPLMEGQKFASNMQKEMISEIEAARPEILIYVNVKVSWLKRIESDTTILSWADGYVKSSYEKAGIVDIFRDHTEYRWDDEVKSYQPRSPVNVYVFRRKT